MCGIAGILGAKLQRDELTARLKSMQGCLRHRGPDGSGLFVARQPGTGFAHTRLSIIELSEAGHQPMSSDDARYHIVFNGEIYNYAALREELIAAGETLRSHSDTEVILRMYERYGADCVREFEGMFAFSIWDERERSCFIARGPLGVKPLYYHERDGVFLFGSEVRALLASELVPRRLSPAALRGYLLFGAVPEPLTLIADVQALPAGHHLFWRDGKHRRTQYWNVLFDPQPVTPEVATQTVRQALEESIDRHFVSDVPVGVFLSGGIDSTSIVALASKRHDAGLRTFCISFDDPEFDEGEIARRTAAHFGTEHFDWRLDAASARPLLHQFLERSDQPSIDGFNTFCVAKHAHDQGAKVVLSGLGGDELFGGYRSFQLVPSMIRVSRALNVLGPLRRASGALLETHGSSPRARRLGGFMAERPTSAAAYWCMRGVFTPEETAALVRKYCDEAEQEDEGTGLIPVPPQPTFEDEVSYLELTRYMRNQLLRDSDVMSMAWGLELRVPFVDSTFVNTIGRIPARIRLAPGKQLLLAAVPELPEWVRDQPKRGFVFPFEKWINREWKDLFVQIEAESPVRLQNWYRRWCLLALESFLHRNRIPANFLADAA